MTRDNHSDPFEKLLAQTGSISFRRLFYVLASRWYWITGTLLLSLATCYIYIKIAAPRYEASTVLRFPDKQSEFDDLKGKGAAMILWRAPKDYLVEKYNVNSLPLLENVLERIGRPFSFRRVKDFRKIDVYPFQPVIPEVLSFDEHQYENGFFEIDPSLFLHYTTDKSKLIFPLAKGDTIEVPGLLFAIHDIITGQGFRYEFTFKSFAQQALLLSGHIEMEEVEENLPIMRLSFQSKNEFYAKDLLTHLVDAYQSYSLLQKQASHNLSLQFITGQKTAFADSLRTAARELEDFRQKNELYDVAVTASELTLKLRELEQELHKLYIQKAFIQLLEEKLYPTATESISYFSVGLDGSTDPALLKLIDRLNDCITRRKELALRYHENSPALALADDEIRKLRRQIQENLHLQKSKNEEALKVQKSAIGEYREKFRRLPGQERSHLYLRSKFSVNQDIYSLLLNKEIESAVLRAGLLPAFSMLTPIEVSRLFPNDIHVLILFLFLGLFSGIGLIFYKRNSSQNFRSIDTIGNHPNAPLTAIIPRFHNKLTGNKSDVSMLSNSRGLFTERINTLRTKIVFSNKPSGQPQTGQLVMITSEQAGEGKSFLSLNLALSLARINKKTLLVECDLRKPGLGRYFDQDSHNYGLSEWMEEDHTTFEKVIYQSPIKNLDYIPAGKTPAFPGELLQKERLHDLFASTRPHYDYILIDTAPAGLVSDNIPLLPICDHIIFTMRWLFSGPHAYRLAIQLATSYKIPQIILVVNDFHQDHLYDSLSGQPAYGEGSDDYYYHNNPRAGNAYFKNTSQTRLKKVKRFFVKNKLP